MPTRAHQTILDSLYRRQELPDKFLGIEILTSSKELGQAMLEISARTKELANGTLLDNGDSLAYSKAYLLRLPKSSD